MKQDRVAFDRAASTRVIDADGHLHVASSVISAAAVNPYNGSEIPDYETLGLDPKRVYQLLRDPAELEKAAPTFNGKPLLIIHKALTADAHDRDVVVGSVNNPVWDAPTLKAELVVWDAAAIEGIESDEQKELSCGYRYRCVVEPGAFEGTPYDARMVDIVGNHVALVREGRVKGAVVGDSAFQETKEQSMSKVVLTRKGAAAFGALSAHMKPRIAKDQKIDLAPLFAGVSAKNFTDKKAGIVVGLSKLIDGKLAKDANIDDVTQLLDALEDVLPIEVADPVVEPAKVTPTAAVDPDAATDSDDAKLRAFLKSKGMSDEDIDAACKLMSAPAAMDESEEDKKKREADEAAKSAKDAEMKNMVTKPAMDAAITSAVKAAHDSATKTQVAIREAERAVRPYVGELALAHDSAEAVYRTALGMLNVETKDVHPSAFPALLKMAPVPGSAPKKERVVGMDSAVNGEFDKMFPNAKRIRAA